MNEWEKIESNWNINFSARTNKKVEKSGLEEIKVRKFYSYFNNTFELIKDIGFTLPKLNESKLLITMKSFSAVSLIDYIIKVEKSNPVILICFIYSLNEKVAKKINDIAEETKKTKLIISDLQNTAYRTKERAVLENLKSNKIEKYFVHSHAKIVSIKFNESYYTILGSGNLSENARVEHYQIINSIEMFDFINDTFDEIREIQVKKRNNKLWRTTN